MSSTQFQRYHPKASLPDCFRPLVGHEQWRSDVNASSDRVHPGQAGYGLIAWLVLHNGWNDWMRISA